MLCSPMRPVGTRDYGAVRDGPRLCNGNGTVTPFCSRRSSDNVRTLRKRTVPGGGETVRLLRLICCATGVVLAAAGTAAAQAVSGSQVSGIVRDSSGGAIPGADVTITKTDTGVTRTVFTDG